MLDTSGSLGVIKLYLGKTETATGMPVFLLGQFNPPLVFAVPPSSLLAMHRIVATVSEAPQMDEGPNDGATLFEAQLDTLSPFFRDSEATAPVGREWRPIDLDALIRNTNLEQAID